MRVSNRGLKIAIGVLLGLIILSLVIYWKSISILYGHIQSLTEVSDHLETGEAFHSSVHSMLMFAKMAHESSDLSAVRKQYNVETVRSQNALKQLTGYTEKKSSQAAFSALVENTTTMAALYEQFADATKFQIEQGSRGHMHSANQSQELFDSIFHHLKRLHKHHREQREELLENTKLIWHSISWFLAIQITACVILSSFVIIYVDKVVLKKFNTTERFALHDQLTGMYNRHALSTFVDDISSDDELNADYSIILLDIDHFKNFNDQYGHDAGDAILIALGQTIEECVRKQDKVIRYGGEEILVLLPRTDKSGAVRVAEGVRKAISENRYQLSPGVAAPQVTISAGVSSADEADSFESIVKLADQRLYEAKHLGRNQVGVDTK
ncbi:MAG: hypothetical protein CL942_00030 [Desulfovibrio sp.]|nr:hypothetical protein [Desulfovibrio sp.]HBU36526.1 hypothetical protein [Planctomycetaceae bacterium]|tara:strand:- start:539 stop:1687 length:1149 start_codon:yes stop_codon:yes gene_type:complete